MKHYLLFLTCLSGLCLGLSSCQQTQLPPPPPPYTPEPGSYAEFVYKHSEYPKIMDIFMDTALMDQANSKNARVAISLDQQRGRLYVKQETPEGFVQERVAADWPVSTGVDTHVTPTGNFRIRLKKKDHSSNRYGKMYDANGKCINRDADAFKDPIPEGGKFVGAGMPNWMRLTSDGVGMHTGKVRAGERLSHGCIRTPGYIADKLFDITDIGTRVSITQGLEPSYPAHEALAEKERKAAEEAALAAATAAAFAAAEGEKPEEESGEENES